MSSPPQVLKQDNQTSMLHSKLNTGNSLFYNHAVKRQEETIFEKQTVKISPSLHKKDVPRLTFLTNENHITNS